MKIANMTLMLTMTAALTAGCSQKIAFTGEPSQPGAAGTGKDPVCDPGQTTATKPTKFILVVDQSGSNMSGPKEHPGYGTDPDKGRRYGAISEFFLMHGQKKHVSWSFISFYGSGAQALTHKSNSARPAFVGFAEMLSALSDFKHSKDDGTTPYLAGLGMARDLIAADLQAGVSADTQYRIAFLTDGYPTDEPVGGNLEAAIDAGLKEIVSLSPENIQMSTVYYGQPDASASARLQRMAVQGKGQFLDASDTTGLHLGDVIQVPKPTCN